MYGQYLMYQKGSQLFNTLLSQIVYLDRNSAKIVVHGPTDSRGALVEEGCKIITTCFLLIVSFESGDTYVIQTFAFLSSF